MKLINNIPSFAIWLTMVVVLAAPINTNAQTEQIRVNFKQLSLTDIIDSLSNKYNVNFSYNADLPVIKKLKSIDTIGNISQIVSILLKDEEIGYKIIDKQVVLFQLKTNTIEPVYNKNDTLSYIKIAGTISDFEQKITLPYANVFLLVRNIGTTTNSKGEFLLKIPKEYISDTLVVSYIGYKNYRIPVSQINYNENLDINLSSNKTLLPTVIVKPVNIYDIIDGISRNRSKNYSTQPANYTAFFRESTKEDNEYITICEAVVDIYKSAYNSSFEIDKAKIYKGRKSENEGKVKNLKYKFEGGINNCLMLDIVKDLTSFTSTEFYYWYDYKYEKIIEYEGRELYVISFDQKEEIQDPLFKGIIYVDVETKALIAAHFSLSPRGMKYAQNLLIKKHPRKFKIKPIYANYRVSYREIDNKWCLDNIMCEIQIKAKSDKLFVNSTYTSTCEMVVTQVDTVNVQKYKWKDVVKANEVLSESIQSMTDENFWGRYNIIKPEEPVIEAIKRLSIKQNLVQQKKNFWESLF
jgi:hypothetical protein